MILPLLVLALDAVPACPAGNLLAGPANDPRLTDGVIGAEGAAFDAPVAVVLPDPEASMTWDLGAVTSIGAVYLQADGDDVYSVQVSRDGVAFEEVWAAPALAAAGLRARQVVLDGVSGRFVRVGLASGDGRFSLSEVQVYCQPPETWPPRLTVAEGSRPARAPPGPLLNLERTNAIKLVLALVGVLAALFTRRRAVYVALGLLGLAAYGNFGWFHFSGFLHHHELFHYHLGAKYFPELGYTRLYDCVALAEADLGYARRVRAGAIRDLVKNELMPGRVALGGERAQACRARFTSARWRAFTADVDHFRGRLGANGMTAVLLDHGYNPSPAWTLIGARLANLAPASQRSLTLLALLDPLLLLVAFGFVYWAFGLETTCLALLFFGTFHPSLFFWTGGAFLRQDWLAATLIGLSLLKRGRPFAGGAALGYAALVRIFPALFFAGLLLRRGPWRAFAGAALVALVVVPLSGVGAWPEFARNTVKHAETPLTNNMGLNTVLGFRPHLSDPAAGPGDPFRAFSEGRRESFRAMLPVWLLALGVALFLVWRAAGREAEPWAAAAVGFALIPVALELTCYYYSFLTVALLFRERRPALAAGALALSAACQIITFATSTYVTRYMLESVAVLIFAAVAVHSLGGRTGRADHVERRA